MVVAALAAGRHSFLEIAVFLAREF
jgi:hypothetical protein